MKKLFSLLVLFILVCPALVWAHPGHGETGGYTIIHYFTEPQHAIVTIPVFLFLLIYFLKFRRQPENETR